MKIAVTILVAFLVLLDFGLITACGVMERRLKDDDVGRGDKSRGAPEKRQTARGVDKAR